jgi:hypothetical protein
MESFNDSPAETQPKTLEQTLAEKGIECPPITLNIFFGTHTSEGDFDDFIASNPNPDILIIENIGYNKDGLDELLYRLAEGTITPEDIPEIIKKHPFYSRMISYIAEHKTPPLFIDLRHDDAEAKQVLNALTSLPRIDPRGSLLETKQDYIARVKQVAETQKRREGAIIKNFSEKIVELLKNKPSLLRKPSLSISMFYGATHTGLYHQLKDIVHTKRKFQDKVIPFELALHRLIRHYMFIQDEPSEELVLNALYQSLVLKNMTWKHAEKKIDWNEVKGLITRLKPFREEFFEIIFAQGPNAARAFIESKLD